LLLVLAAVLVALGAGFFGLATLSREGVVPPDATVAPTARATGAPKPVVAATSTSEPSPTPEPSVTPAPVPSPTPVPPNPTAPPPPPSRAITVAQLRGKTLDQAQAALKADGLSAQVRGVNVNVDKDVVADQQPDAGATLPPGGTVTIMVGTGSTAIPDVANQPRDQATKTLQNNSFHVTVRQRRDQRIPENVALETRPKAGTVVPRQSDVELWISSGR
jgi:hypothetical protein